MPAADELAAQVLADRSLLTITVALAAWATKRIIDATLPRGWHFRIVERWLTRPDPDDQDDDQDDDADKDHNPR